MFQQVKYSARLRYVPPTMATAGKVIQAAGVNLFGVQKTFEAYDWKNHNAIMAIKVILMISSIFSTLGTRGIKNFEYFLLPNIDFTDIRLHDGESFSLYRPTLLQENYIISSGDNTYSLFKILDNGKLKKYTLSNEATLSLEGLYNAYQTDEASSLKNLDINGLKKFDEIKKQKQLATDLGFIVQGLYWFIYIPCVISMIFSTMVAFLAGTTLADEFGIPKNSSSAFIYYATASNAISYCTFNLTTMNTKVTALCQSISDGSFNDSFKLPWKILLPVVLLTIFGMAANLGFAFFSMYHFFQIAALNQAVPQGWQLTFISANVYVSIYTGMFNFAASALDQTKKILEPNISRPSLINLLTTALVLTDTSFNCLGAFLGIATLTGYLNPHHNKEIHNLCLALNIMMTVSYDYLTFGMSRNGCEKLIRWLETCFHSHGNYQRSNSGCGMTSESGDENLSLLLSEHSFFTDNQDSQDDEEKRDWRPFFKE